MIPRPPESGPPAGIVSPRNGSFTALRATVLPALPTAIEEGSESSPGSRGSNVAGATANIRSLEQEMDMLMVEERKTAERSTSERASDKKKGLGLGNMLKKLMG